MTTQFEVGVRLTADGKALVGAAREAEQALDRVGQVAERVNSKVSDGERRRPKIFDPDGSEAMKKGTAEAEAALGRYLAKVDPTARAIGRLAEGQLQYQRALSSGALTDAQAARGLALLKDRYDDAIKTAEKKRLTVDNMLKGKLAFNEVLKLGALAAGGWIASLLPVETVLKAIGSAIASLSEENQAALKVQEAMAEALKKATVGQEKYKQTAEEMAATYKAETANVLASADAYLKQAEAKLASAEASLALRGAPGTEDVSAFAMAPEHVQIAQLRETIKRMRGEKMYAQALRGEFAGWEPTTAGGAPRPPSEPDKKPPRAGAAARTDEASRIVEEMAQRVRALDAALNGGKVASELDKLMDRLDRAGATAMQKRLVKAQFEDIKNKEGEAALRQMETEHRRGIDLINAEIAGNRELTEAIRLKAQIEAAHGKAFADASKDRIEALAAEKVAFERGAEQYRALTGEISQLAGSTLSALNDAAVRPFEAGEKAAKRWLDVLTRGLQDVQRLAMQLAVMNPIQNWLDGGGRPTWSTLMNRLLGDGGGGGFFDRVRNMAGGGGGGWLDGVFNRVSSWFASLFHEGGLVGAGAGPGRLVPAMAFAGAPRMHGGGILPGERPAILSDGEGVFTPRQMSNADGLLRAMAQMATRGAGDDGRVSVAIYDQRAGNGRSEASAEQRRGAGGEREIRVFLRDAVREGIARGDYDGVAGQAWGVSRRGAGR